MNEYIKIAVVDSLFEAQMLDEILRDQKIPHMMKSYYDTAYDGLFQGQKGWGAVFAPAMYGQTICELLAELRTQS